jgi:hypothetical protein
MSALGVAVGVAVGAVRARFDDPLEETAYIRPSKRKIVAEANRATVL